MSNATIVHPEHATQGISPAISRLKLPEPFTLVLFGATGDLAGRKLFPAMLSLWQAMYLPKNFAIIGNGRREKTDTAFREEVKRDLVEFKSGAKAEIIDSFLPQIFYQSADITAQAGMQNLADRVAAIETELNLPGNRLFYAATDPEFFRPIVDGLAAVRLISRDEEKPWGRVVIEKPFGQDLKSALALNRDLLRSLRPEQIYRIDHYLGKETVQNLMAFRFGNSIFEPHFSRELVDHVQITVAETVGMEGKRGAFYDHAGALRDVVQNHMLQLVALIAMDPPATLQSGDISDAKLKVLRSLTPLNPNSVAKQVVRGQYGPGTLQGQSVRGYRAEDGVDPASNTETFLALRASVDSWRWAGVPFFLRTGKRLPVRSTEIAVQYKLPPLQLFRTVECMGDDVCDLREALPSVLVFRIQPNEGISLSFSAKRPGMQLDLHPVRFEFNYDELQHTELPEAYERLLLDVLRGDATLFMRSDELEAAWQFVTPILDSWQNSPPPEFPNYAAGTWGPPDADRLMEGQFGGWRN